MFHSAQDRRQTYSLFSRLLARGLAEADLDAVRRIPPLARHISAPFDPDAAAADHQHLFGFNVFPYESVFLDPSGQLGGEVTLQVIHAYQQSGFQVDLAAGSPDHIGPELDFLAFLCQAEAAASGNMDEPAAWQAQESQAAFLDSHLLRWLPPLLLSIRKQEHPFYTALIDLMAGTIAGHRSVLALPPRTALSLPQPPNLLEEEGTRLTEIVTYLLTPAHSAIYLSRDDIGRLARDQNVPRGFGERRQMLLNLMRSTAAYGDLVQLLLALQGLAESWADAYRQMAARWPIMKSTTAWMHRAAYTAELIDRMRARAADFISGG